MPDCDQNLIIKFLRNRRSVLAANLQEPGPDEERLNEIIQIGLRVPDHSRCGPWRIQIIRKNAQAKLGDCYALQFKKNNLAATSKQVEYWRFADSKDQRYHSNQHERVFLHGSMAHAGRGSAGFHQGP